MQFEISVIQLITVCAVLNGFVFTFLLLEKKENRKANRFLSLTILSLCLTFTPFILDNSIWNAYEWMAWLPFSLSYWIGPSFFFYIRSLTTFRSTFKKRELWHFSLIPLNYLHSIYHALVVNSNPWPWFHHLAEWLESGAIISIIVYLVLSYRKVKNYQNLLLDNVSTTEKIDLRWVNQFIWLIAGSCGLILIFLITSMIAGGKYTLIEWDQPRAFLLLTYAFLLYWLAISGFKQAQTHTIADPPTSPEDGDEARSEIIQKIQSVIESEALYRNAALSLADLSRSSGISERSISDAINKELGKNFFQFINEYRVAEIKQQLSDPKNDHLKIISLALDAGFNSKASFNRVFKSLTGLTPQAFKAENK